MTNQRTKQQKQYGRSENKAVDMVYGKVPPQATDLEEAVLGAILLEKDRLEDVMAIIPSGECFYSDPHRKIFEAVRTLFDQNKPVDLFTVIAELKRNDDLEQVGGHYYLTTLTASVVTSAHVEEHARIIMEHYMKREMIKTGGELIAMGYDPGADVFDSLNAAAESISSLAEGGVQQDAASMGKVVAEVMTEMDTIRNRTNHLIGIPTPFPELNDATGGWQPPALVILAARPGVGKTAFALQLAQACAEDSDHGGPIAFFNLEVKRTDLGKRLLSNISNVPYKHVRKAWLQTEEDIHKLAVGAEKLAKLRIHIDDTPGLSLSQLRTKARKLKRKQGIKMIIIDYLQLMNAEGKVGNREQEVSSISRGLKKLGKELDIPIIALSQLNRGIEGRKDNTPVLGDLRESGAIEQDADIVMFLYGPSLESIEKDPSLRNQGLAKIAKNRDGETDLIFLYERNFAFQRWEKPAPVFYSSAPKPEEQNPYRTFQNRTPPQTPPSPYTQEQEDLPF